ncbi:MAG: ATP-binding protein, partial [Treponema sp.]|nr:ATP-binding protein [Treponema sp.]
SPEEITHFCSLTPQAKEILEASSSRYDFSPRAVSSCMKLSRTIADISGKSEIDGISMQEAVVYRRCEGGVLM